MFQSSPTRSVSAVAKSRGKASPPHNEIALAGPTGVEQQTPRRRRCLEHRDRMRIDERDQPLAVQDVGARCDDDA